MHCNWNRLENIPFILMIYQEGIDIGTLIYILANRTDWDMSHGTLGQGGHSIHSEWNRLGYLSMVHWDGIDIGIL